MLECKLCDYYQTLSIQNTAVKYGDAAMCGFTGVLFAEDVENMDNMEYPCRTMSYDDYLNRIDEIKSVSIFQFTDSDWRYHYKKIHAASALDRYMRRAI